MQLIWKVTDKTIYVISFFNSVEMLNACKCKLSQFKMRHQTCSDALENSFPPELFHIWILCLILWPIPSPQRSLGHSLFKQKISLKFLLFLFFVVVSYYQNFKINTPWRNAQVWARPVQKERKQERIKDYFLSTSTNICNGHLSNARKRLRKLIAYFK